MGETASVANVPGSLSRTSETAVRWNGESHVSQTSTPGMREWAAGRAGADALVRAAAEAVTVTHLRVGQRLRGMRDDDGLALTNAGIEATEKLMRGYKHIAVEVPLGSPQIEWSPWSKHWVPRGDVLRAERGGGGQCRQAPGIRRRDLDRPPVGGGPTTRAAPGR